MKVETLLKHIFCYEINGKVKLSGWYKKLRTMPVILVCMNILLDVRTRRWVIGEVWEYAPTATVAFAIDGRKDARIYNILKELLEDRGYTSEEEEKLYSLLLDESFHSPERVEE